jgi:hypothetical protein
MEALVGMGVFFDHGAKTPQKGQGKYPKPGNALLARKMQGFGAKIALLEPIKRKVVEKGFQKKGRVQFGLKLIQIPRVPYKEIKAWVDPLYPVDKEDGVDEGFISKGIEGC